MRDVEFLARPWEKAIYDDLGLDVPIYHLLGNRIGIYPENTSRLSVSAWKRKDTNKTSYTGKIHISPLEFYDVTKPTELLLIEDMNVGKTPEGYPIIAERMTRNGLVTVSLYYPKGREFWNFDIHLTIPGAIKENDFELFREGRLNRTGLYQFQEIGDFSQVSA